MEIRFKSAPKDSVFMKLGHKASKSGLFGRVRTKFYSRRFAEIRGQTFHCVIRVEGIVRTVEPETGRIVIPVGQTIIFQRADCKKCLNVMITDGDGNYKLRVGEGKYRVIVNEAFLEGGSTLDPKQPEFVNANDKVGRNVFDINLRRSRNAADIEIK